MPRLFVAVEVPEAVREAVAGAVVPLREALPSMKWVAADRYHLTLVFIGSVDQSLVAAVGEAVAAGCAGVAPFPLRLDGRIGWFGRRVVWAGLAPSEELASAAAAVAGQVRQVVALPDDDRPFRAHLTLARAGRERVRAGAAPDVSVPGVSWQVGRVVLLRSAGGYHVERAVELSAAGP